MRFAVGRELLGGAGGRTRTDTAFYSPRILSPVRLPFRHTGNTNLLMHWLVQSDRFTCYGGNPLKRKATPKSKQLKLTRISAHNITRSLTGASSSCAASRGLSYPCLKKRL